MTKYNTNLAAEFYVLSMLYRLGLDASLTLGNKKAVDIVVTYDDRIVSTIDVKGLEKRFDWPAENIIEYENDKHFYALVSFEGKIEDPFSPPSVWVIPANRIKHFKKFYNTRSVISRALIIADGKDFLHAWTLITQPGSA